MSRYNTTEKEDFYYMVLEALNDGVTPRDLFEIVMDAIEDFKNQEEVRESYYIG